MHLLKKSILIIEILLLLTLLAMFVSHVLILTESIHGLNTVIISDFWQLLYKPQLSLMFLAFTVDASYGWLGPVGNLLIYIFLISIPITGLYLQHERKGYVSLHLVLGALILLHFFGFLSAYGWALGN